MLFTELAVQNVRGFSPSARVSLKSGYWVLSSPDPSQAPLVGLLCEACYPDGRGADAAFLAPGAKSGKAGLLLQGNEPVLYRLMRELGGAGALHRLAPGAAAYEPISTDPSEMTGFLKSNVGLLDRRLFEGLFCFREAQLPSRGSAAKPASKGLASQSQWAGLMEAATGHEDPAAKLAALEQEQRLAEEVEKLQYRLDGLASQVFQAEEKVKSTEGLETQVREARAAFAAAPTPERLKLPADIVARAERLPAAEAKLQDALAKLEADRAAEEAQGGTGVAPLYRDWRFWSGVGVGMAVLVAGMLASGAAKYLALLDVPAFGFAAMVALKYVDDVQSSLRVSRKGDRLAERERKLRDAFAEEANPVKLAISALGVEAPADITAVFAKRPELGRRVAELEAELATAREAPDFQAAFAQLNQLKAEQASVNSELGIKGAYVRDLREIEREMAKAREALGPGRGAVVPAASTATLVDPAPGLLKLGADLLGTDPNAVGGLVRDRVAQYFAALTDRRWMGIELGRDGTGTAVGASGKSPLQALPARDLDFAYLALRLTLLEKYSAKVRVPIVFETLLDGMEDSKLPLLAKMLKHLGGLTQVLHLTSRPAFASVADGNVKL